MSNPSQGSAAYQLRSWREGEAEVGQHLPQARRPSDLEVAEALPALPQAVRPVGFLSALRLGRPQNPAAPHSPALALRLLIRPPRFRLSPHFHHLPSLLPSPVRPRHFRFLLLPPAPRLLLSRPPLALLPVVPALAPVLVVPAP